MNGEVTLLNAGASLALTDPAGAPVSIAGSTTTGLQEFVNLVASSGFPGRAVGSGVRADGGCPAPFVLSAPLKVPPMLGTQIDISGTINVDGFPHGYTSGIEFDTLSRCKFHHHGVINLMGGDAYGAISFRPVTEYAANAFYSWRRKEIYGSSIRLGNINALTGAHNALVKFWAGAASFNNNIIEIGEVLARDHASYGVYVDIPSTEHYEYACFVQNIVRAGLIDGAAVGQFCEGGAPINPAINCIGTNLYEFAGITFGAPTTFGVSFSGVMNIAHIPSISKNAGSCQYGIIFVQGSQKNYVVCPQNHGAVPVNDSGSGNVVIG